MPLDRGLPTLFVDAELGHLEQEGCAGPATCRREFESVLFDLRPTGLPRLADLDPSGERGDGGALPTTSSGFEQDLVSRHGPLHLQVKLAHDGALTYQAVFPGEAELEEQPISGKRLAVVASFGQAVKAACGRMPSQLALLEYSDWEFRPRADAPVNSPPVVTVYALGLDEAGRVLTGDDGARLAAGFSFVLGTRSVESALVLLRRPGSDSPSWLAAPDAGTPAR